MPVSGLWLQNSNTWTHFSLCTINHQVNLRDFYLAKRKKSTLLKNPCVGMVGNVRRLEPLFSEQWLLGSCTMTSDIITDLSAVRHWKSPAFWKDCACGFLWAQHWTCQFDEDVLAEWKNRLLSFGQSWVEDKLSIFPIQGSRLPGTRMCSFLALIKASYSDIHYNYINDR